MISNIKKTIVVDILIGIFFLLMLVEEATGLFEDELLAAVLLVLFAMHIAINRKCIAASIKSIRDRTILKKEWAAVVVNLALYGSMIICSLMALLSMDFYIIDFDMDFEELYVFFVVILVLSFILHIVFAAKSIEDIIKEKLNYK